MLGCLDLRRDGEGGRISSSCKEMEGLNKKEKGVYIEGSWGGERANLFSVHKWALKTRLKNMGN